MSDSFECPKCGHEHFDAHELAPFEDTYECHLCGETFWLEIQPRLRITAESIDTEMKAAEGDE